MESQDTTTLFTEMENLQTQVMAEQDLKVTFSGVFDQHLKAKLMPLILQQIESQLAVQTDFEVFKFNQAKEDLDRELSKIEECVRSHLGNWTELQSPDQQQEYLVPLKADLLKRTQTVKQALSKAKQKVSWPQGLHEESPSKLE